MRRLVAAFVTLMCAMSLMPFGAAPAFAASSSSGSSSSSSSGSSTQSAKFEDAMSGATGFVDTVRGTGHGNQLEVDANQFGDFAAGLGYPDTKAIKDATRGSEWPLFMTVATAKNAVEYSFAQQGVQNVSTQALQAYGRFGYTMARLGYDSTANSGVGDMGRWIQGSLLHASFYGAAFSHNVMVWSVSALRFLNPFGLFLDDKDVSTDPTGFTTGDPGTAAASDPFKEVTPYKGSGIADEEKIEGGALPKDEGANGLSDSAAKKAEGDSPLGKALSVYKDIYKRLRSLGLYILLPLSLAFAIFMFVMAKASNRSSNRFADRMKKYGIRLIFIAIGIPMMGSIYTAFLNSTYSLLTSTGGESYGYNASSVIFQTLVDYQGWVEKSNMSLDGMDDVACDKDGNPTNKAWENIRNNAIRINKTANGLSSGDGGDASRSGYAGTPRGSSIGKAGDPMSYAWNAYDDTNVLNEDGAAVEMDDISKVVGNYDMSTAEGIANALITSYTNGEMYESGMYATYLMEGIANANGGDSASDGETSTAEDGTTTSSGSGTGYQKLQNFLLSAADPENYGDGVSSLHDEMAGDEFKSYGALNSGELSRLDKELEDSEIEQIRDKIRSAADDGSSADQLRDELQELLDDEYEERDKDGLEKADRIKINSDGVFGVFGNGELKSEGDISSGYTFSSGKVGFAGGAMYNYLNTLFTKDGFRVYSPKNSSNTESRIGHYATSLVGGGVVGTLTILNAMALMVACTVTGAVYGLMMLVSNAKRSLHLIISAPIALAGGFAAIARTLLLGLALVAEILGSILAYAIMSSVLNMFGDALARVGSGVLPSITGNNSSIGGVAVVVAGLAISTIFHIMYIFLALRMRTAITAAIDDGISGLINRITGVQTTDIGSESGLGAVKSAFTGFGTVAGGAGVASAVGGATAFGVGGAAGNALATGGAGGDGTGGDGNSDIEMSDGADGGDGGAGGNGAFDGEGTSNSVYSGGNGMEISRDSSESAYEAGTSIDMAKDSGAWYGSGGGGYGGSGYASATANADSNAAGGIGMGGQSTGGDAFGGSSSSLSNAYGEGGDSLRNAVASGGRAEANSISDSLYAQAGIAGANTPTPFASPAMSAFQGTSSMGGAGGDGASASASADGGAGAGASADARSSLGADLSAAASASGRDGVYDRDISPADGRAGDLRMAVAASNGDALMGTGVGGSAYASGGDGSGGAGGMGVGGAGVGGAGFGGQGAGYGAGGQGAGYGTGGNADLHSAVAASGGMGGSGFGHGEGSSSDAAASGVGGDASSASSADLAAALRGAQGQNAMVAGPSYQQAGSYDRDIPVLDNRSTGDVYAEGGRGGEGASAEATSNEAPRNVQGYQTAAAAPMGADVVDMGHGTNVSQYGSLGQAVAYGQAGQAGAGGAGGAAGAAGQGVGGAAGSGAMSTHDVRAGAANIGNASVSLGHAMAQSADANANVNANINGQAGAGGAGGAAGAGGRGMAGMSGAGGAGGSAGGAGRGGVGAGGAGGAGGGAGAGGAAGGSGAGGAGGMGAGGAGGAGGGAGRGGIGAGGVGGFGGSGGSGGIASSSRGAVASASSSSIADALRSAQGHGDGAASRNAGAAGGKKNSRGGIYNPREAADGAAAFRERMAALENGGGAPSKGVGASGTAGGASGTGVSRSAHRPPASNNTLADARMEAERRRRLDSQRKRNGGA